MNSFSVIIPLYNKEAEIGDTLRSVLAQTLLPLEIVVVDDGSTDRSAQIVEESGSPLVRLIRQSNAGECAARNRAIAAARGDYMALLDADDSWKPDFLAEVDALIGEFPDCGIYSTSFDVVSPTGVVAGNTPAERGVVENLWAASMRKFVCIPSASVLPKCVIDRVGGFPEGMKMGGDQYTWIKIASLYRVCFSPRRLCNYSMVASNRSGAIYRKEQTNFSFEDFYDPCGDPMRNEFVARCAIGKAITLSAKGDTEFGVRTERFFGYTRLYRRGLRRLKIINRLPAAVRPAVHALYQRLAWLIVHRGQ